MAEVVVLRHGVSIGLKEINYAKRTDLKTLTYASIITANLL